MSFPEYVHLFKAKMVFERIASAFREMTINSRRGVRFKHDTFRVRFKHDTFRVRFKHDTFRVRHKSEQTSHGNRGGECNRLKRLFVLTIHFLIWIKRFEC